MVNNYISFDAFMARLYRHPLMKNINEEQVVEYIVDLMRIVGVPSMFTKETKILPIKAYRAHIPDNVIEILSVNTLSGAKIKYSSDIKTNIHSSLKYRLQGNILYLNRETGEVEVEYTKIATDSEGMPLMLDNSSFLRAAEAYVKKEYFAILRDIGEYNPNNYQSILQEYSWAVGDLQSEFNRLNEDQFTELSNRLRTPSYRVRR